MAIRVVAAFFLAMAIAACTRAPSERALREAVSELQDAVAARDARRLSERLAEDFIGPDGLDRDGARRTAAAHFLRHAQVGATAGPLDVRLNGDHATVRFDVLLTGGSGGWLPQSGRAYAVESGWRFEDGAWRMTSARWEAKM